ncbi:MAG: hypothetical protein MUD16_08145 [Desulfobacterales bacterium]|jgi:hypothetical protein|nr:hypothetical protein [Desulfobacterales bacterium]
MDAEEFLDIISECDVLREDIEEIRERVALTASEGNKLAKAAEHVEKAKSVLAGLFPTIRSLGEDVRQDLAEELAGPGAEALS